MSAIDRQLASPEVAVVREPAERLSPLDRLNLLADEGSLRVIRSEVTSERMGAKARPGDGVIGGSLRIAGRPAFAYAQDAAFMGGSLGAQHADTIVRIQRLARQARVPVIGFVESGGARMQEGLAALNGYARIFSENVASSGVVPQISIITGTSAGGGSYSPALTDFVVMTQAASMFLTGPAVVREVMGEDTTAQELGGPRVHGRNGVCDFTVANDVDAIFLARQLLTYLPASAGEHLPLADPLDPAGEEDPGDVVPLEWPEGVRRARRDRLDRRRRLGAGGLAQVGAEHRDGVRADRGRAGRHRRQPAALPGRCDRRRRVPEGRVVHPHLQPVRRAAGGARRHAGLPARLLAGVGRGDPARGDAAARVRREHGPALHGRAAQGVRRGLHHDELQGSRRGPLPRVEPGRAGDHGRRAGRRRRAPPGVGGRARSRSRNAGAWPTSTPSSTSRPAPRRAPVPSTRSSNRARPGPVSPGRCPR